MEISRNNKLDKIIVNSAMIIICLSSLNFVADNLRKGYFLIFRSSEKINAVIIGKITRETSEGTFFDYVIQYEWNKSIKQVPISIGEQTDKEYNLNDTIGIRISNVNGTAEALSNMSWLRVKYIVSVVLIVGSAYFLLTGALLLKRILKDRFNKNGTTQA